MLGSRSFVRLRLVLRGLGFIFPGWTWIFICRGFCRDFWGRGVGWRLGWVRSEENHAARRNYLLLVGMGSWVGDLRWCAIGRGVGESYHRGDTEDAEKYQNVIVSRWRVRPWLRGIRWWGRLGGGGDFPGWRGWRRRRGGAEPGVWI